MKLVATFLGDGNGELRMKAENETEKYLIGLLRDRSINVRFPPKGYASEMRAEYVEFRFPIASEE